MTTELTADKPARSGNPAQEYPGKPLARNCEWCGSEFETRRITGIKAQRFCSESHRVMMAQYRKRQAESAE